jgi:uncharacterized membrane protein YfcA
MRMPLPGEDNATLVAGPHSIGANVSAEGGGIGPAHEIDSVATSPRSRARVASFASLNARYLHVVNTCAPSIVMARISSAVAKRSTPRDCAQRTDACETHSHSRIDDAADPSCPLAPCSPGTIASALTQFDAASLIIPPWLGVGHPLLVPDVRLSARAFFAVAGLLFVLAEGALLAIHEHQNIMAALLAVFVASAVSSVTGFAFSALSGALLFHLLDSPIYAVQVIIICNMATKLSHVATLWRSICWPSLPVFLAGGFLGVPAGVYLMLSVQTDSYQVAVGVLLVACGAYLFLHRPTFPLRMGAWSDVCVGALGGLTAALAGGVFVTIWCALKGWDKARQRGVYQPFILMMQPVTLIVLFLMRQTSLEAAPLDWLTLAFIPPALLGAWIGLHVFERLSERQFEWAANALLIVSGIGLML